MKFGDMISKLRKKGRLSQEQLAEKIGVTRQTISNWELGETQPNPEQLKLLSKTFNISIDELLGNDIKYILEEKVSNTEKLAGMIINGLKVLGIVIVIFIILNLISILIFGIFKTNSVNYDKSVISLNCGLDGKVYNYLIEYSGDEIIGASGSEFIDNILKDKEFTNSKMMVNYIESYFKDNGGSC